MRYKVFAVVSDTLWRQYDETKTYSGRICLLILF